MKSQTNSIEKELKLANLYNNQLKYINIREKEEIVEKIKSSLDIIGIEYLSTKVLKQIDKYYDTDNNYLLKNNGSIRYRRIDADEYTKHYITIKTKIKKDSGNALSRHEREEEFDEEFDYKGKINNYLLEVVHTSFEIREAVQIINERISIRITTGKNSYNLCFDKYFFCVKGRRSDDYYEIEIESENDSNIKDKKIEKLCALFTQIFDFKITKQSKYEQGMSWKCSEIEVKNKQFVLIDIVDYSKKNPEIQKDIVIMLNKKIRICLEKLGFFKNTIALPIGDGAILVFEEKMNIIRFVEDFVSLLNEHNDSLPDITKIIEVRLAVHYGPVFEFPDINGSINYAGNGINVVARIASKTKAKTILASNDFFNWCRNSNIINLDMFNDSFEIEVKHGEKIQVREVKNSML